MSSQALNTSPTLDLWEAVSLTKPRREALEGDLPVLSCRLPLVARGVILPDSHRLR